MTPDETAIRQAIATWIRASEAGDAPTILSLVADDVVFHTPGGAPFGKKEFGAGPQPHRLKVKADVLEVVVSGDHAFTRVRLDVSIVPTLGAAEMKLSGYTMSVFKRGAGGKWQIWRDANLLAPVQG